MSKELNNLTAFMAQLAKSGMSPDDMVARGYDYALALFRSSCEIELPRGAEISATQQVQMIDHAADLLKVATEQGKTEQHPIDEHIALYQQMRENMMSKNTMLYDYLMDNVVKLLPGPQAVEDALNMMCVSMSKTPLESLLLIHEFLSNYHNIVRAEHKAEQAKPESPYMVRGES
jgi:hypothetical protein